MKKIYVIGVGLIGGSLALDIKKLDPTVSIYGVDKNEEHLDIALARNVIDTLNFENVKLNVTAVFTTDQVVDVIERVVSETPMIISIFAGCLTTTSS